MTYSNSRDGRSGRTKGRVSRRTRSVTQGVRLAPIVWMALLAAFIVAVGILPAAGDPVTPSVAGAVTVRVSSQDTLWTIAAAHRLPGLSTAQMVDVIRRANSISGTLPEGAVLQVPAPQLEGTAYAQVSAAGGAQ